MKLRVEDGSPGDEGPSQVPEPGLASDDKGPWGSSSSMHLGRVRIGQCARVSAGRCDRYGRGRRQAGRYARVESTSTLLDSSLAQVETAGP